MSNINTTLWDLAPHTAAKHTILKEYLQAWIRIMTLGYNSNNRAVYIDGFAGPGEYSKGEDGSPIIALKEAISYCNSTNNNPQLRFIFIEEDEGRYINLVNKIADLFGETDLSKFEKEYVPKEYNYLVIYVLHGSFEGYMKDILGKLNGKLAPTFAFIDPFGFRDMPFYIIKELLKNDKIEVFINFMYEHINRFLRLPSLQDAYYRVFGTEEWKEILTHIDEYTAVQRRHFLHALYKDQLHSAGLKHVISFEMRNENNATDYFLYYGTNHIKGLEKMKDTMWKVDNSGAYSFSDYKAKQQQLEFEFTEFNAPDLSILATKIFDKFSGQSVYAKTVKDFVVTDTIFRRSVHSTYALKLLEESGKIKSVSGRQKRYGYPEGSIITFEDPS